MKIALLSTNYDLGGAAVVTKRLADALRAAGHDARMVVARAGSATPSTHAVEIVNHRRWTAAFIAERAELFLKGVSRKNLFKVSTGRFGIPANSLPFVDEADAIIVNWTSQGLLSLDSLEEIVATGKPVIYVMHDLWPATAVCHLPGNCKGFSDGSDCAACPFMGNSSGRRLAELTAQRKRQIFAAPNLHLVTVSNWQRDQVLASTIIGDLFKGDDVDSPTATGDSSGKKTITVIPHVFPAGEFLPGNKILPGNRRLIVMAAARLDDPIKDLPTAIAALNTLAWEYPADAENVEVAFVGEIRDKQLLADLRIPYTCHGLLQPSELRQLYAQATIVMSSSKFETMGATLMEGMSCGAIPVTFGDGGQADIVTDGINGFIAPTHTAASLAFTLSLALQTARIAATHDSPTEFSDSPTEFSPDYLHNEVTRRFSPDIIANRYLTLLRNH